MDLTEALAAVGVEYRPSQSDDAEIWVCCPFCVERGESPDSRFRLGINILNGESHCFNCGWSSRSWVRTFSNLRRVFNTAEFAQAQEIKKKKPKTIKVRWPEDFAVIQKPGDDTDIWNDRVWRYLRSRKIPTKMMQEKSLGYTTVGKWAYRAIIPVLYQGKLRGLVGRDITGKREPKYYNSPGLKKSLYNLPDEPTSRTLTLVEGCFDALAIERAITHSGTSLCDVAAVLGHSLTDEQVEQVQGYKKFILWFDPDKPGQVGACRVGDKLLTFHKEAMVVAASMRYDSEFDPSDLEDNEILHHLGKLLPYSMSMAQRVRLHYAFEG